MKHTNFSTHRNNHHQPPHPHHHNHPPTTHLSPLHRQIPPHYSDYDRQLADEVLYLHSLWHRGPPHQPPSHSLTHLLHPTHTTHFKKTSTKNKTLIQPYVPSSDKPWPVSSAAAAVDADTIVPGPSGCPVFKARNQPVTRAATAQEQARAAGVRIQLNAVESCRRLINGGGGDEEEEEEDEGDDEEEVEFFENLFEENSELRGFYVRNCGGGDGGGGGEFVCLVCGVIGNKVGRKYKNCVALVQHSRTVSKTKKKKAHRAYGSVLCKLLGWDVDRLPSFPTLVGGEDLVKGEVKNQADKDPVVGELGRDAMVAEPSQTEREIIPDAPEKDNITSTNVVSASTELTHGEGEVKQLNDDNSTAVEMEGDAANASHSQSMPESTPNVIDNDNDAGTDVCMASAVAHTEVESHDSEKEKVCSNPENAVSQRENESESNEEEAVKNVGEESSVLGGKPSERESSMAGDDPFEELPCLPGAFQIPE